MFLKSIVSILLSFMISSSAFSTTYVVSHQPRIVESYPGTIIQRRWVQYDTYRGNNEGAGTLIGAVTGGAVGSAFGKGSGRVASILGGALIGGLVGNSAGRNTAKYQSNYVFEYTIRMQDGNLTTILQSPDVNLPVGQNVVLERSSDYQWYLIPQFAQYYQ